MSKVYIFSMLQNPNLDETLIITGLAHGYGLHALHLSFLPIGNDVNTVIYKAATADGSQYFVKLRRGGFDEVSMRVAGCLYQQGIAEVMAPIESITGQLWVNLGEYRLMLYPFIEGHDGYTGQMTDQQWQQLGRALRAVHSAQLPAALAERVPRESYSPLGRDSVRAFMMFELERIPDDAPAQRLVQILRERREEFDHMLSRTDQLAVRLMQKPCEYVLCHADIHAGNVLLSDGGLLYIVDWDAPLLAPKERDLMYIGAWGKWSDPRAIRLFYEGYGATQIEQVALIYYRYEHFIQDLYEWCKMLLLSPDGGDDRAQAVLYLEHSFDPDGEYEIARKTDELT